MFDSPRDDIGRAELTDWQVQRLSYFLREILPANRFYARKFREAGVNVAALSLPLARPAAAAWLPFNPAAGSRWIVETENNTDDTRNSGNRSALIKSRAEIIVDDKTADGFKVTYVLRSATVEGNDPYTSIPGVGDGLGAGARVANASLNPNHVGQLLFGTFYDVRAVLEATGITDSQHTATGIPAGVGGGGLDFARSVDR